MPRIAEMFMCNLICFAHFSCCCLVYYVMNICAGMCLDALEGGVAGSSAMVHGFNLRMKNSFGAAAAADESQSKSKNNSPNESWRVLTRFSLFSLLYLLFLLFGCSFCCLEDMHKNALHFRFSWQRCCCCCCCCDFLFGCKLLLPVASGSIALRSVLSCAASES